MKHIFLILIGIVFFASCSEDGQYLTDGGVSDPRVNMSTMEFFKSHEQLDTLAILIERADLVGEVNGNSTVFAPNNSSIKNYVDKILSDMRELDPEAEYTLDDIPTDTLTKYMGSYIFSGKIKRENMTKEGKIYTANNGEERRLSLEPTEDYENQLEDFPEYVYITYKVGDLWDAWDEDSSDVNEKDDKFIIRTSNIQSTNGVIHVIQGSHRLFNYETD